MVPTIGRTTSSPKSFDWSSFNLLHEESDLPRGNQLTAETTGEHLRRRDPARPATGAPAPRPKQSIINKPPGAQL
jgi:hypothetical protein